VNHASINNKKKRHNKEGMNVVLVTQGWFLSEIALSFTRSKVRCAELKWVQAI